MPRTGRTRRIRATTDLREREQHEAERQHDCGGHEHLAPAELVDVPADRGPEEAHQHERHRERAEHPRVRKPERRGDRVGEDCGQVIPTMPTRAFAPCRSRRRRRSGSLRDDQGGDRPAALAGRMLNVRHAAGVAIVSTPTRAAESAASRRGCGKCCLGPVLRITISGSCTRRGVVIGCQGVESAGCEAAYDGLRRQHDVLADLLGADADPAGAGAGDDEMRAAIERYLHWCVAVNPRIG